MVQHFIIIVFAVTSITVLCIQGNLFQGNDFQDQALQKTIKQLEQFNREYETMWWMHQRADWNYSTNVTSHTMNSRTYVAKIYSLWIRKWKLWARGVDRSNLPDFVTDALDVIAPGIIVLDSEDARLISELRSQMTKIYSEANISIPDINVNAQGEADYSSLMGKNRDPEILKTIWRSWRLQVGENTRSSLLELIQLTNKAARENGYENVGSSWRSELGSDDILYTCLSLWDEVKMFYSHLHAYTRHKIMKMYGHEYFSDNSLIPAHLLGSLWGENWIALENVLKPYSNQPSINLTDYFITEDYSVRRLMEKAEEFYITAGLSPMNPSFWENSMFTKPRDGRVVDCHPASYDFGIDSDYRIRMCGERKEQSFLEAIHEMGHIQYYMAYNHLPMIYHNAPISAFHEAVGETMVYAAQNLECLDFMKLVKSARTSNEVLLNTLMKQALSKFVLLPWVLTVETWRYSLLADEITDEDMNEAWWSLRKKFQGIEPPDDESAKLFDAGTKYHIINNIPYMRYFVGRFLEHQFLESLCNLADENIHSCCFIKDKRAGKHLKNVLALGSSVTWPEALEALTGERELSSRPLMNYYKPLYLWLVDYNAQHNITPFV